MLTVLRQSYRNQLVEAKRLLNSIQREGLSPSSLLLLQIASIYFSLVLNRKVDESQKSLYIGMGMSYFKKYKRVRLTENGSSSDEVRFNQARIFQFLKQPEKANDIYKELTAST